MTRRILTIGMALALPILTLPILARAQEKSPVPSPEKIQKARAKVRELFQADYAKAKTSSQKAELIKRLQQIARDSKADPAARYVLLDVARKMATDSGNVALALQVVAEINDAFETESAEKKLETITRLAKAVRQPLHNKQLAAHAAQLFEEALAEDEFKTAEAAAVVAMSAARRGKDTALVASLIERSRTIPALKKAYEQVKAAKDKLDEAPTDPDANLEFGRYLAFKKGQWERGLPMLALGSDPALEAIAKADLTQEDDAKAQYDMGNRWWDLSEKTKDERQQTMMQNRAAHWYQQALPKLTGVSKLQAQQRLKLVKPVAGLPKRPTLRTINLISLIDPETDCRPKDRWEVKDGVLQCTRGSFVPKVIFPYQPPQEYDVRFEFSQPRLRNGVGLIMPHPAGGKTFAFGTGGAGGDELFWISSKERIRRSIPGVIRPDVKYAVEVKVRKDRLAASINGKAIFDVKTDFSNLEVSMWHKIKETENIAVFCDDPAVFTRIELTEVSGKGKLTRPKD